jgi:hypothetical protein
MMKKGILPLVLALTVLVGLVAVRLPLTSGSSLMEVSVSPQDVFVDLGQSFSVDINISSVQSPGVYSYQLCLYYDNTVLKALSAQIPSNNFLTPLNPSNVFHIGPTINQSAGCVTCCATLLGEEPGKTGSGVLVTVQFMGLAAGISLLELRESDFILVDSSGNEILSNQYELGSGTVSVSSRLAGINMFLSPSYSTVKVGQFFSVNVNIAGVPSPGVYSYGFCLYYDNTVLQGASAQIPSGQFFEPISPSEILIADPGTINQTQGQVHFELSLLSDEPGATGSGVLASVQFTGLAGGTSPLEFGDVYLVYPNGSRLSSDQYSLGQASVWVVPVSLTQRISVGDYSLPFDSNVMLGLANVTVDVLVGNASNVAGGSFEIYFDKRPVNSVSLSPGDFGSPSYSVDYSDGFANVTIAGSTAVNKDVATLAKITCYGVRDLILLRLQNGLLNDEEGNTFAPLTKDGSITVLFPQITISPCIVEAGSAANVSIVVLNAENMAGFSMNMTFNSSVINVVHVFPGDFGVPVADVTDSGSSDWSVLSVTSTSASAVGKTNATLAVLSCVGINEGRTFFYIQNMELSDEQGNLWNANIFQSYLLPHGGFWGLPFDDGGHVAVSVVPEYPSTGIFLVCLLLGSISIMMKKKPSKKWSAHAKTRNQ